MGYSFTDKKYSGDNSLVLRAKAVKSLPPVSITQNPDGTLVLALKTDPNQFDVFYPAGSDEPYLQLKAGDILDGLDGRVTALETFHAELAAGTGVGTKINLKQYSSTTAISLTTSDTAGVTLKAAKPGDSVNDKQLVVKADSFQFGTTADMRDVIVASKGTSDQQKIDSKYVDLGSGLSVGSDNKINHIIGSVTNSNGLSLSNGVLSYTTPADVPTSFTKNNIYAETANNVTTIKIKTALAGTGLTADTSGVVLNLDPASSKEIGGVKVDANTTSYLNLDSSTGALSAYTADSTDDTDGLELRKWRGVKNGYAPLGIDGKIDRKYLYADAIQGVYSGTISADGVITIAPGQLVSSISDFGLGDTLMITTEVTINTGKPTADSPHSGKTYPVGSMFRSIKKPPQSLDDFVSMTADLFAASSAEVTEGSDNTKYITPAALAGSAPTFDGSNLTNISAAAVGKAEGTTKYGVVKLDEIGKTHGLSIADGILRLAAADKDSFGAVKLPAGQPFSNETAGLTLHVGQHLKIAKPADSDQYVIDTNFDPYVLPPASTTELGGVKLSDIVMFSDAESRKLTVRAGTTSVAGIVYLTTDPAKAATDQKDKCATTPLYVKNALDSFKTKEILPRHQEPIPIKSSGTNATLNSVNMLTVKAIKTPIAIAETVSPYRFQLVIPDSRVPVTGTGGVATGEYNYAIDLNGYRPVTTTGTWEVIFE